MRRGAGDTAVTSDRARLAREDRIGRNIGVGCFTFVVGAVSGGMIAVLLGKLVGFFTRAPRCPDVPMCNWYQFAGWGALVGAISLPLLAFWRLRRVDASEGAADPNSNRG